MIIRLPAIIVIPIYIFFTFVLLFASPSGEIASRILFVVAMGIFGLALWKLFYIQKRRSINITKYKNGQGQE